MCKKLIYSLAFISVLALAGQAWAGVTKPDPADGAVHEETWVTLSWQAGPNAASFDVYLGEDFDSVNQGINETFRGNQTLTYIVAGFPGFPYPNGLVPGTTYYWRVDEVQTDGTVHTGPVWSFAILAKTAGNPSPADGAESVGPDSVTLSWAAGFGAKLHTVYFGDDYDQVNNATGGIPQAILSFNPGPLELEKIYYWRVDEFDAVQTYKGDIWSFTTPGYVGNPQPANEEKDVEMNKDLTWTPADSAASHQLYFGTDREAVLSADTGSPEYKGPVTLGDESYDPGLLDPDTTYSWRVDEIDSQGNAMRGPVWSFTTGDFLLVEGFEEYSDDDTAGEAIWQHWIDGFGVPENGAQVGYLLLPYAEQKIVHSGLQSMPLQYVNTDGVVYSEAERTITDLRDWTVKDMNTLTVSFWGKPTNAAEPMYVTLNGNSPIYRENPNASQVPTWSVWNIDLQEFVDQGVDLTNVNKIAIGFGDKNSTEGGGSGTVYFDDIRLGIAAHPVLIRPLPFEEDFEGVELSISPDESPGTQGVWTDTPPAGWAIDESGIPGIGDPAVDGVTDWAGWAFADKEFWINTDSQSQRRHEFTLGQGVIAVADCDEWDDKAHPDGYNVTLDSYDTWLSTPPIDISGAQPSTVQLTFDSSWRPEYDGDYHQTANITAFYNDQDPVEVLLWESDSGSPNFKDDNSTNETITVDLNNPSGATSVILTFGLYDACNDWWWAIDNIKVTGIPK